MLTVQSKTDMELKYAWRRLVVHFLTEAHGGVFTRAEELCQAMGTVRVCVCFFFILITVAIILCRMVIAVI